MLSQLIEELEALRRQYGHEPARLADGREITRIVVHPDRPGIAKAHISIEPNL